MNTIVYRFSIFGRVSNIVKTLSYDGFDMTANRHTFYKDTISSFIDLRNISI